MNAEIRFYIATLVRRLPTFLLVFLTITTLALFFAFTLPTLYSSSARLLFESPQISDELATTTVENNTLEQIEIIQQRMSTRAVLLELADTYRVFDDLDQMLPDEIVDRMQSALTFRRSAGRDRATLLNIGFSSSDPRISANVVNDIVTRILESNARQRTSQAEDTLVFFEDEVARLGVELDEMSQRIVAFQDANAEALPDTLTFRLTRQTDLQERLGQLRRERAGIEQQKRRLEDVFRASGQVTTAQGTTPRQRELNEAQRQLDEALTIYSRENPRVRVLQSRVDRLQREVEDTLGAVLEGPTTTGNAVLDLQVTELDGRVEDIDTQIGLIANELEALESTIRRTPSNAVALAALERDYENTQLLYNQATSRLAVAQTGERIEQLAKGERITVVEQATPPDGPTSPNRPLIALGGTALGFLAGVALLVALELTNQSLRRPVDMVNALGFAPLATVPYLRTDEEVTRQRMVLGLILGGFLILVPLLLVYIHFVIMPLDLLVEKISARMPF